jgi:hypothetical protein
MIRSVCLHGLDNWVITKQIKQFSRKVFMSLFGQIHQIRRRKVGKPEGKQTLEMEGQESIEDYVSKGKETVTKHTHLIEFFKKKCKKRTRSLRYSNRLLWWKSKKKNDKDIAFPELVTEISDFI